MLTNRLLAAQKRLVASAGRAKFIRVPLKLSFREGSKIWAFEEAIVRIEKHIRGHFAKLKRYPNTRFSFGAAEGT